MPIIPPTLQRLRPEKPPTVEEIRRARQREIVERPPTKAEIQAQVSAQRQRISIEQKQKLETERKSYLDLIERKKAELRTTTEPDRARQLERDIALNEQIASRLREASIVYATGDYDYSSIRNWAVAAGAAPTERAIARREIEPKLKVTMREIPRTVITREGTFLEYKTGERVKISEERIPTPIVIPKPELKELGRIRTWMAETPTPQERLAKTRFIRRGVEWIRVHRTPLEVVSEKIVKYDVPIFVTPQPLGLGIGGWRFRRPSEVAPSLMKSREKTEEVIEVLEKAQLAISEGIRPIYKEERESLEKEIDKYTKEIETHNKEVEELNKEIKEFEKNPTTIKYNELVTKGERLDKKSTLLEKDYERIEDLRKFYKAEKKKVPKVVRISQSVWVGFLSAPVGLVSFGLGLAVRPEKELVRAFRGIGELPGEIAKRPIEVTGEIAGHLAFFGLTGYGIAKIRATRLRTKIKAALETGETKVISRGALTETKIGTLKISAGEKAQLRNLLRQGRSVRLYDTYIKYPKKTKYTPDVRGTYVEVMDNFGNVIERISVGRLKAVLGKKTIDRISVSDAIEKLNEKTGIIQGYQELVIAKAKPGVDLITGKPRIKYKKARGYRFYEEIKPITEIRRGKVRLTISEATHELLGVKKYRGKPLLKEYGFTKEGILIYPEYKYLKGKGVPYAKGQFVEVGISAGKRIQVHKLKGFEDLFLKTQEGFATFGRGTVQRIKITPTKPIYKGMKGFTDKPIPDVIVKYPPPKAFKEFPMPDYSPQDFAPLMVGGGGKGVSQWYGKQVLVPETFTPEVVTTAFAGELPLAFVERAIWTGTLKGVGVGVGTVFRPRIEAREEIKIRERLIEPTKVKLDTEQLLVRKELTKQELQQRTRLEQATIMRQDLLTKQSILLQQNLIIGQTQLQQQRLKQVQKQLLIQKPALIPTPITPVIPTPPIGFLFFFPGEKEAMVVEPAYFPEVYVDATKIKKAHWKRISGKPMTKRSAMSLAAEEVDNTISARGRAVKSKKKHEKVIDTGEDYFMINKFKFRTWKQKKGVRTKLPENQFIESQKYRLDKPGEVRKIKIERKKRRTPFGF